MTAEGADVWNESQTRWKMLKKQKKKKLKTMKQKSNMKQLKLINVHGISWTLFDLMQVKQLHND